MTALPAAQTGRSSFAGQAPSGLALQGALTSDGMSQEVEPSTLSPLAAKAAAEVEEAAHEAGLFSIGDSAFRAALGLEAVFAAPEMEAKLEEQLASGAPGSMMSRFSTLTGYYLERGARLMIDVPMGDQSTRDFHVMVDPVKNHYYLWDFDTDGVDPLVGDEDGYKIHGPFDLPEEVRFEASELFEEPASDDFPPGPETFYNSQVRALRDAISAAKEADSRVTWEGEREGVAP